MITWMQKHKKYLIVTIWVSTITFVGAGFVGWGQYHYGDKASAIAKVGNINISLGDLQKSYSSLYAQYNQMFKGEFDEEKAKSFGLKKQAFEFLTNQALVLNLASYYDLEISDAEIAEDIKTKEYFFKDGSFDKQTYEDVLSKNNLSKKAYEESVKKELLIQKVLNLLDVKTNENEQKIIDVALGVADKIEYKILDPKTLNVEVKEDELKTFWEKNKTKFMKEASYSLKYISTPPVSKEFSDEEIESYYKENKDSLKSEDGKVLELQDAKITIIKELNAKESKNSALRAYIAFKKGEDSGFEPKEVTLSATNNPFNEEIFEAILALNSNSNTTKPIEFNGSYYSFILLKTNPAEPKSFEEAQNDTLVLYKTQLQKTKALEIAKNSLNTFSGTISNFVNQENSDTLTDFNDLQKKEFLNKLSLTQKANDFITLNDGTVIMYKILEQKLLTNTNKDLSPLSLKSNLFNEGLVKTLKERFKTEIFMKEGI